MMNMKRRDFIKTAGAAALAHGGIDQFLGEAGAVPSTGASQAPNLENADLTGADLEGIDFSPCKLANVTFDRLLKRRTGS